MKIIWFIIGLIVVFISIPVGAQNAPDGDYAKTVILHYSVKGPSVTFLDAKVIYGYPPNLYEYSPKFPYVGDFTGRTLGAGDVPLKRFGIDDPRITYTETGAIFAEEANLSVKVPYSAEMNALGIYDKKDDSLLVKTEVKQVVADFCKSHPEDPDCKTGIALPPTMLIVAAVLIVVCVLAGGWLLLRRGKGAQK